MLLSFEKWLRVCKDDLASIPDYILQGDTHYDQVLGQLKNNAEHLMEYGNKIGTTLNLLPDFGNHLLEPESVNAFQTQVFRYCKLSDSKEILKIERRIILDDITDRYYFLKPFVELVLKQGRPEELIAKATAEAKELQRKYQSDPEMLARLEARRWLLIVGVFAACLGLGITVWKALEGNPFSLEFGFVMAVLMIVGFLMMFASGYPEKINAFISATLPWFGRESKS
jgi:hypothetical protein